MSRLLLALAALSAVSAAPAVAQDCPLTLHSYEARLDPTRSSRSAEGVYDGDTVWLEFRLGFGIVLEATQSSRLYGIDAPERYDPGGLEARQFVLDSLPVGEWFMVNSIEDERGKYGRYLIELCPGGVDTASVNRRLVDSGHATWVNY